MKWYKESLRFQKKTGLKLFSATKLLSRFLEVIVSVIFNLGMYDTIYEAYISIDGMVYIAAKENSTLRFTLMKF